MLASMRPEKSLRGEPSPDRAHPRSGYLTLEGQLTVSEKNVDNSGLGGLLLFAALYLVCNYGHSFLRYSGLGKLSQYDVLYFVIVVGLGWVAPIAWGVHIAKRKGYSPLWMLLGVYPVAGWIAVLVLGLLPSKTQCTSCGGFVGGHFKLCPHCHKEVWPRI